MEALRYLKWPFIFFLVGVLVWFTAMLLKIRHWPFADELFIIAWLILLISVISAIAKLLLLKK